METLLVLLIVGITGATIANSDDDSLIHFGPRLASCEDQVVLSRDLSSGAVYDPLSASYFLESGDPCRF